jgi:ornithine decarboxylase
VNDCKPLITGAQFSTIHITPEEGFSYCSVELSNIPLADADPEAVLTLVHFSAQPQPLLTQNTP